MLFSQYSNGNNNKKSLAETTLIFLFQFYYKDIYFHPNKKPFFFCSLFLHLIYDYTILFEFWPN